MKKIFLLALTLFFAIGTLLAQGYKVTTKVNNLESLKSAGIKVVIPSNKFGEELKKAVSAHWNSSAFEFITASDLEQMEDGKEVFLLGLFNGQVESPKHYLKNVPFIGVVDKHDTKNNYKTKTQTLASVVYPEEVNDEDLESMLTLYVKILNNLVASGGVKEHMKEIKENGSNGVRKGTYVNKEHFKGSLTDIRKKFSGKIKKVEEPLYREVILNEEDVLVSLDVTSSNYHFFAILSNKTGLIYSFMFTSTITPKTAKSIQEFTFKRLAKL